MIKLAIMSAVALVLYACAGLHNANAQDSMVQGPSKKTFLECATNCQKSFYFSENSDPTFAELRNACIEGCSVVEEANMSAYQSCNVGCQDIFPYRHGTNPEFADFQQTCIVGCRRVH
jgi:hypothetical protein